MREYAKPANKSKFSLINGGKDVKFYIQSSDPDKFLDDEIEIPSVIAEITYNYKQYHVDTSTDAKNINWLYLSNYPEKVKRIVENIRYQVPFTKVPSVQVAISCCVALGLTRLHASGAIRRLSELCGTYKRMRKTGSLIEGFIGRYFDMEITCEVGGKESRARIPKEIKDQILLISSETGLTQSSVGILAIYATLAQQDSTPPEFKQEWQEELDNALELVECKYKGAKTIMEMLK